MSWLFSRALVAAYSAVNCSDGEQSAPLNAKCIPHLYLHSDKTTDVWSRFPSGMTCERLTDGLGAALLTWYLAAFPARTFPVPERAQESAEQEADSGPKWQELSVRYDPATSSWRTHRCLFTEDLQESSVTLPRWGMMRDGVCWERMMSGRRTRETESGLWRTPKATEGNKPAYGDKSHQGLACQVKMWPTPCERDHHAQGPKAKENGHMLQLATKVKQMWPTPTTQDNIQVKGKDKRGTTLGGAVRMWPTPTVSCATGRQTCRSGKRKNELLLAGAVKAFPTPKSRDWKGRSQRGEHAPMDALPNMITGSLNPDWVELLMGWPLGWTDIDTPCEPVIRPWDAHWEDGVPRVTTQSKNRALRLKAIGNGQVPAVAALAWEVLTNA